MSDVNIVNVSLGGSGPAILMWGVSIIGAVILVLRRCLGARSIPRPTKVRLSAMNGLEIEGEWAPNDEEKRAAWELYVELVTRTAVVELPDDEGLLSEAMESLHSLLGTIRRILREYGPAVCTVSRPKRLSFGHIAVQILNNVLRPVLAKWHPVFEDYQKTRKEEVPQAEYERAWEKNLELRQILRQVRAIMRQYADLLEAVAGVPSLLPSAGRHSTTDNSWA